jgi:pyruvate dehydrogenase E2 component (dihydrolipoamide acetyltransferase)
MSQSEAPISIHLPPPREISIKRQWWSPANFQTMMLEKGRRQSTALPWLLMGRGRQQAFLLALFIAHHNHLYCSNSHNFVASRSMKSYILTLSLCCVASNAFSVGKLGAALRSNIMTQLSMADASKITMPALSSTMKEGRVVSWLKNEGEAIEAGEAIMVVESDKADMDVEAFEDGFLAKIIVGEGEMAPVGEPVALIASEEKDIDSIVAAYSSGGAAAPAPAAAAPAAAAPAAAGECQHFLLCSCHS